MGRAVVNTTTSSYLRRTVSASVAAATGPKILSLSSWSRTRLSSQSHNLASTSQYARPTVYTPSSIGMRHHQLQTPQPHGPYDRPTPPPTPLLVLLQGRQGQGGRSPHNHVHVQHNRPYSSKVDETRKDHDDRESQRTIQDAKEKQNRAPWHREGPSEPPVRKTRSTGSMTKGESVWHLRS